MKKLFTLILALAMVFALAACGDGSEPEAAEPVDVVLSLDWTPNTNHTGIYVALANGYFEDAGLNVTVVQPPEAGAEAMCAANQAQFAVAFQDTMAAALAQDEPLGITAVCALLQHNTSGVMSRAGEGMDRPAGLVGHSYATWNSPIELAMMEAVVEADGGDFSQVELIPNNFSDEPSAIREGLVDSIWVYYGWACINAEINGVDFDYFSFTDIDPVFDYYTPVLVGNNEWMEANPDATRAFLAALKQGYEYAAEHPAEAAQMLIDGDDTGSLRGSEELVTRSQEWISGQYIADAESWGVIDAERWDAFYAWLWDNGLVERELPAGTGFTNEYLE